MEHFTEEHSKLLLGKEWLVRIDTQSSTPYLIKFYSSLVDMSCCVIATDTKDTWAEVLNSKQFARRWRGCNRVNSTSDIEDEDSWRKRNLEVLSRAHTLGGIRDLNFELVESHYADVAFELECEAFKWRWEVVFIGHKLSAGILSRHLIIPLLSANHLAFSSAEPVSELSESDLEKAVDKMARTARRTVDTHVKHAISKPRVATTIQRITALFNFAPDLPTITSTSDIPELHQPVLLPASLELPSSSPRSSPPPPKGIVPRLPHSIIMTKANQLPASSTDAAGRGNLKEERADSATESESENIPSTLDNGEGRAATSHPSLPDASTQPNNTIPAASKSQSQSKTLESDSESSPARPAKKAKADSSSDYDSEVDRKRRVAMLKGGAKRGTKQPIKRGGKRF